MAPGRTAVVGDAPADLRMARAAGAGLVVGVLTGVGGRADLEPLADVVLDSVAALGGRLGDRSGRPAGVRQLRPPSRRSMNRNRLMKSR